MKKYSGEKMKKSELKYFILYLFLLIPFFKTDFMARYDQVNQIFNLWKMISIFIIFIMYLKKGKITKNMLILICFEGWQVAITAIYNEDVTTVLNCAIIILALAMILESAYNKKMLLSVLLFCFEIVIYINFITVIMFPTGMYTTGSLLVGEAKQNWFLGFKNVHIVFYLPAILISLVYSELYGCKRRRNLLIFIVIFCTILCQSSTSIIGISILLLLLLLNRLFYKKKIFEFKNLILIICALFLLVIIFRLQDLFSYLFVDLLGKDLTFSNRTLLWDTTMIAISKKMLCGYGWQAITKRHLMYNSETIISSHNQILEYLYIGGIILLGIYIYIIYRINKETNNNHNEKIVKYISISFFVLQIIYLTEVFINPLIYLIIIIPLYQNTLFAKSNMDNKLEERTNNVEYENIT